MGTESRTKSHDSRRFKSADRKPNHCIRWRTDTNRLRRSVGGGGVAGLDGVGARARLAVGLRGRRRQRREEGNDVGAEEEDGEAQEHELDAVHRGSAAPLLLLLLLVVSPGEEENCRKGTD